MIATAVMWYSFSKAWVAQEETGGEANPGKTVPLWFTVAPVAVDIAAYWMIASAIGGI